MLAIPEIAQSMRARMPWSVGQKVLAEAGIEKGLGWDRTVNKLTESAGKLEGKAEALDVALREHLLCGEKICTFYELDADTLSSMREKLLKIKVLKSVFSDSYPEVLPEVDLAKVEPGLLLTAIERNDDGIGVVFSSVRVITLREAINQAELPKVLPDVFDQYEEIIGVKTVRYHAYDIVWIPHDGKHVDVRIDFPIGTHQDVAMAARGRVTDAFQTVLGGKGLGEPINLFSLIDRIYLDPKEGTVVELAFGTSTASLKHEKMRRKKLDLRKEQYHQGGKAALKNPIEPFRLSVVWNRQINNNLVSAPELSINSNARASGMANPIVESVVVRKCIGLADYEFVRSRIEHHIAEKNEVDGEG